MKNKVSVTLTLAMFMLSSVECQTALAVDKPSYQPMAVQTPATVVAPGGLSDKDQNNLEKQYSFSVKNKSGLLSPYIGQSGESEGVSDEEQKAKTEDEKIYRFYRAAMSLYREGRLEEAIEILQYIRDLRPDDEYIKNYLEKVVIERDSRKKRWNVDAESKAKTLRQVEIRTLLRDGADYYKQKRFDKALLKYADALALDPGNGEARSYFNKLKEYYLKEVRIDSIVDRYESGKGEEGGMTGLRPATDKSDKDGNIIDATQKLLDKAENKIITAAQKLLNEKEGRPVLAAQRLLDENEKRPQAAAERLLDEKEMELIVKNKRVTDLMDQADLGLQIEDIIAKKKDEERRANLFTLGAGDSLVLSVRDHPELSGSVTIRLNGEIVLPLVNDVVKIKGLTVEEATDMITKAMKRYVKDPYVTLTIADYRSKNFYVIDEIGCTAYPITRANLTLKDALFISDWGQNRALGRVIVMKPDKIKPIIRKIDAFDIIYRGNLTNNIRIEDGDVIYVPLTAAAKITQTISDALRPFAAIRSVRDEWINLKGDIKSWQEMPKVRQDQAKDAYQDFLWGVGGAGNSTSTGSISI